MAVKTVWEVTYRCGHTEDKDLSGKAADQRAGFAKWLSEKSDCTACWRRSRDKDSAADRATFFAQLDAERTAWEQVTQMPALDGSEKQIPWASRIRHSLLTKAFEAFESDDAAFAVTFEDPARAITAARWWIDQKDADPADLPELFEAAGSAGDGGCENPFG